MTFGIFRYVLGLFPKSVKPRMELETFYSRYLFLDPFFMGNNIKPFSFISIFLHSTSVLVLLLPFYLKLKRLQDPMNMLFLRNSIG